jgi:hypothetical protein
MAFDNFSSLWQIYIDVIAGLTRNPWWLTQSALQRDGCRVKPGMTTLIKSPDSSGLDPQSTTALLRA